MVVLFLRCHEEPNLYFWEEGVSLSVIFASLKVQRPNHFVVWMLRKILQDLLQGRAILTVPFHDSAISIGEGFEWRGGSVGTKKSERNCER